MPTTLETIVEHMIRARDEFQYEQAEGELFDLLAVQSASCNPTPCIRDLLVRMLEDESLRPQCTRVLNVLESYVYPVIPGIIDFIESRPEDMSAARLGLGLIEDENFRVLSEYMDLDENLMAALASIMNHGDDTLLEYTIAFISKGSGENRSRGSIDVILEAMRNRSDNEKVQTVGLEILLMLSPKEHSTPLTILQVMNNHVSNSGIQESACKLFESMLKQNRGPFGLEPIFSQEKYAVAIFQAMRNNPNNVTIQGAALGFIERIRFDVVASHIVHSDGVGLVLRVQSMILSKSDFVFRLLKNRPDARRQAIEFDELIPTYLKIIARPSSDVGCVVLDLLLAEDTENKLAQRIASEDGLMLVVGLLTQRYDCRHPAKPVRDRILERLATFPSSDGMLPLHYAVTHPRDEESAIEQNETLLAVVKHLLSVYPNAVRIHDTKGRLPLHIAAEAMAPLSVLEALLHVYPEAANMGDVHGRLPLHVAVEASRELEDTEASAFIDHLLHDFAETARAQDSTGRLPLHLAMEKGAPLSVLQALLTANPEAVTVRDDNGNIPLHSAVLASLPIINEDITGIQYLLNVHAEGANIRDSMARLPLHIAVEEHAPLPVLNALLSAHPGATNMRDGNGRLPLHVALEEPIWFDPLDVLEALLPVFPDAANTADGNGQLPLQVAIENGLSLPVLEALLLACPETASTCDAAGRLPLHIALETNSPLLVLETLLNANPASGEAPLRRENNAMTNFPPVVMAAARDYDLDSIFVLLSHCPAVVKSGLVTNSRKRKATT